MIRWPRRLGLLPLVGSLWAAGCEFDQVHTFSAFHYDVDQDCLDAPGFVDVLSGPAPAPCTELRCWEDASSRVYVTDAVCEAPLDFTDHTADTDGPCPKALAAYGRPDHARCPASPPDAGL